MPRALKVGVVVVEWATAGTDADEDKEEEEYGDGGDTAAVHVVEALSIAPSASAHESVPLLLFTARWRRVWTKSGTIVVMEKGRWRLQQRQWQ